LPYGWTISYYFSGKTVGMPGHALRIGGMWKKDRHRTKHTVATSTLTCHSLLYHWLTPSAGSTLQRPGSWRMLKRQPAAEMALPPLVPLL
jgi:hypothetical protein